MGMRKTKSRIFICDKCRKPIRAGEMYFHENGSGMNYHTYCRPAWTRKTRT